MTIFKGGHEKLYVKYYLHIKSVHVKPNKMKMGIYINYVTPFPRISFLFTRSFIIGNQIAGVKYLLIINDPVIC